MAACGSLHHIFENPLPDSPSLLPWNSLKSINEQSSSSFSELFGELHFKENQSSASSSSSSSNFPSVSSFIDPISSENESDSKKTQSKSIFSKQFNLNGGDNYPPIKNCESLQLCTEGLGFESFDDVEDLKNEDWRNQQGEKTSIGKRHIVQVPEKKIRSGGGGGLGGGGFPPPISCIGKSGKPRVSFKSYREDGRFVLKQVKMPCQEFLHAHRENGRLKLHFVQPSDEILEEDEDEYQEDDDQVEENEKQEQYGEN